MKFIDKANQELYYFDTIEEVRSMVNIDDWGIVWRMRSKLINLLRQQLNVHIGNDIIYVKEKLL